MKKLEIKQLNVEIENRLILHDLNLTINKGETVLILGPNGHGKSTLLKTIMHHYSTKITGGHIYFDEHNTNEWTTDKIANYGVYLSNQYPIDIPGVNMLELIRTEIQKNDEKVSVLKLYKELNKRMNKLNMSEELLKRSINENFSGGERKKSEILQMQVLNPDFILLDEIDSGLDVDAVNVIADALIEEKKNGKAILYISHNDKLLSELVPDKVIVLINGTIKEVGGAELADEINSIGYLEYAKKKGWDIAKDKSDDDFLKGTLSGYACSGK
ncbi:Fe-S cluster assembly ATPase SufC [Ureaplasma ceti]|uniref:Fe-S cluster assembly ATPase SufC n=1 Tax=Ureaplasma ceti TaxID=3119530 RepID=A0ABP9U7P2_9BACT